MRNFDGVHENITDMFLRASYATNMIQRFRNGYSFRTVPESKFLINFAKLMHKYVEMLQEVYASIDSDYFLQISSKFTSCRLLLRFLLHVFDGSAQ